MILAVVCETLTCRTAWFACLQDSWSGEIFQGSLATQPDTNVHISPSRPSNKTFGSQTLKTTCMQALNTPCSPNNSVHAFIAQSLTMGSPSGVEPQCEPQSEQQPAGPTPCSSTSSMQLSMVAGAISCDTVKGTQGTMLALRGKVVCGAAGLRQAAVERLRSLYCWRPAAWAW